MLNNYFKTASRSLLRNKKYTIINVAGLAVGVAVCLMIFVIIRFHTSFDHFHTKKDRAYRILTEYQQTDGSGSPYGKNVPFALPPALQAAFPEVEQVAPVYASRNDEFQVLDEKGAPVKNFKEPSGVFYTSPSFFQIFDFPLLAGSYASLKDPNNVLLTKEVANTYFGDWRTAMGKTIRLTGTYSIGVGLFQFPPIILKVSGVLATIPANTDFQLKMVIAYGTDFTGDPLYGFQKTDWTETSSDFGCYALLPSNASVDKLNDQLRAYSKKMAPAGTKNTYTLQPITAVHYDTQTGNYSNQTISRELLDVLWVIAAFILLIACVNFINLSTAQAVNRSREIGVRKVLGSNRIQLQAQFIIETLLIVIGAVLLAALITSLALPLINNLLELSVSVSLFSDRLVILFLLCVTMVVTALAGLYPSIVLSRFNPVNVLKSKLTTNSARGITLRRGLVVFQFIIAQALIIGTLIIVKQMNYVMDQPLGFDKDAIVNVPFRPGNEGDKATNYLRQQLLAVNGVQEVTFSSHTPVEDQHNRSTTVKFDHAIKESDFSAIIKFGDNNYVPAYKLPLVAGRNLLPSGLVKEFLVNESLVKSLGIKNPSDVLNKDLSMWDDKLNGPIVGVLKDFNNRSFHHAIAPLIITTNATMYRQVGIKLATTNLSSTMAAIQKIWQQTFPDHVYEYKFLDEKIAGFYKQETQLARLYSLFAAIAIFLSCLGLYGLASFMAVQRTREVGIRKVLGATPGSIVYLFSKELVLLIALAFVIAAPIAWYAMQQWLQDYVYRIDISWWIFAAGGMAAAFIALATISFQAVKAAVANPVRSLRE